MSGSLAAVIDSTGISAPDYPTTLATLQQAYQAIYGSDVYLGNDSQDGQFLGLLAQAIYDANAVAIAVFNSFSPATAQGEGLSSVVKINGIAREVPSNSTADLLIGGTVGTVIPANSYVLDASSNQWFLDAAATIGTTGLVVASATCSTQGAIQAPAGSLTTIGTPVSGWQTVTNAADATPGAPVESDAQLRARQAASTALPSQSILDGLVGALLALPGVARVMPYENATSSTNGLGIPASTVALVVDGGDSTQIAQTIATRKVPGGPLAGTTSVAVVDSYGNSTTISFYRPTVVSVVVVVTIKALTGYSSAIGSAIQAAVANYIAGLPIGAESYLTRLYAAAASADPYAFNVLSVTQAQTGNTPAAQDLPMTFNEAATCSAAAVTLVVT